MGYKEFESELEKNLQVPELAKHNISLLPKDDWDKRLTDYWNAGGSTENIIKFCLYKGDHPALASAKATVGDNLSNYLKNKGTDRILTLLEEPQEDTWSGLQMVFDAADGLITQEDTTSVWIDGMDKLTNDSYASAIALAVMNAWKENPMSINKTAYQILFDNLNDELCKDNRMIGLTYKDKKLDESGVILQVEYTIVDKP